MMGIRTYISGMTLILLFASLLLGGLLYLQWRQPLSGNKPAEGGKPADPYSRQRNKLTTIPPFVPLPLSSFSEITERPLFVEGRLPPEPPTVDKPNTVPVAPPQLKLEGVAITSQSRTAVITDLKTKELLRLNEGMSHQDWKVESVGKDSVTIKRGAREIVLKLEIGDGAAAAAGKARPRVPFRLPLRRPPAAIPSR
jgi:hypothetical protein